MAKTTRAAPRTTSRDPREAAAAESFIAELAARFEENPFNTVRQNALAESDASKLVLN